MLFIIVVIIISIAGILYLLFFNSKTKPIETPDNRAIHPSFSSDQNVNDFQEEDVQIVFDEPNEIQHIEFPLGQSTSLKNSNLEEKNEFDKTSPENTEPALTTNSKINPFNFYS